MSADDEMTTDERFKYLHKMKKRCVDASRKEPGHLLDEMEAVTGLHRKSLTQLINGGLQRKPRRRQRGRTYGPEVDDAQLTLPQACPERSRRERQPLRRTEELDSGASLLGL